MLKYLFGLAVLPMLIACNPNAAENPGSINQENNIEQIVEYEEIELKYCDSIQSFSRDSIIANLKFKIENDIPLVVHVFVPMCDNKNQGIVPVNQSLGDGLNLRTNLYWGAGYGIKTHFVRLKDWKLVSSIKDFDDNILERVVFYKEYSNTACVYLIADAYRGDRMRECLEDYLNTLAGNKYDLLTNDNEDMIPVGSNADLVVFNGHNGLMDIDIDKYPNNDNVEKDAVVIACTSADYFMPYLSCAKAYPLITTTNLLAPEAYILKAVIDKWANMENNENIRLSAGDAYHNIPNCGQNGARRLFKTGW